MLRHIRNLSALFTILQILSCNTEINNSKANRKHSETKTIFGLYSYYLAVGEESDCESLKRSLRLNEDSTFVMKEYCNDNYMSTIKPFIKTGIWKMESASVFNFICSDTTTFKIKLLNDSAFEITPRKEGTYPYERDTTTNERL